MDLPLVVSPPTVIDPHLEPELPLRTKYSPQLLSFGMSYDQQPPRLEANYYTEYISQF